MSRPVFAAIASLSLAAAPDSAAAAPAAGAALGPPLTVWRAAADFRPVDAPGFVPSYVEDGSDDPAVHGRAVRTDLHGDQPAAAQVVFGGPAGRYTLVLVAVAEEDGESPYKIEVDGVLLGVKHNPRQPEKRFEVRHRFPAVDLVPGSTLRVIFRGHSNGLVPEGDGFAWARGRWRALELHAAPEPAGTEAALPAAMPVYAAGVPFSAQEGVGDWERIESHGIAAIRSVAGASMRYLVQLPEAGRFYVHLRCHQSTGMIGPQGTPLPGHSTNDAFVTIGGVRLFGSDGVTRPEGIRCHSDEFAWWSLPKGPGGHTPDPIRNDPVHTVIPAPGIYELVLTYRSPGFVVDQIAVTRHPSPPEGQ
jgi:hypothetical protein